MSEYKVIKTPVELYRLRTSTGFDWANIYLTEFDLNSANKGGGELVVYSDYGNWAYTWHNCKLPFKNYLCSMNDKNYFMKKLNDGNPKIINFHETENALIKSMFEEHMRELFEAEEENDIDEVNKIKNQIEKDKEELKELFEHDYWGDEHSIYRLISEDFEDLFERVWASDWEYLPIIKEYSTGLTMFCDKIWPYFIEQLKKEIDEPNNSSGENLPA